MVENDQSEAILITILGWGWGWLLFWTPSESINDDKINNQHWWVDYICYIILYFSCDGSWVKVIDIVNDTKEEQWCGIRVSSFTLCWTLQLWLSELKKLSYLICQRYGCEVWPERSSNHFCKWHSIHSMLIYRFIFNNLEDAINFLNQPNMALAWFTIIGSSCRNLSLGSPRGCGYGEARFMRPRNHVAYDNTSLYSLWGPV